MELDKVYYRIAYGLGAARWDADEPQLELRNLVAAANPGRALDPGCGTGTDAVFMAGHGWEVVGVDYVPQATDRARARARTHRFEVSFIVGDATRLNEVGVIAPFDLAIDVGCYHAIPTHRRSDYASGLAAVIRPGGDFYLWGVPEVPSWRLLGPRAQPEATSTSASGAISNWSRNQQPDGWGQRPRSCATTLPAGMEVFREQGSCSQSP